MADVVDPNNNCELIEDSLSNYPKFVNGQLWEIINGPHDTEAECYENPPCGCPEGRPWLEVTLTWTDTDLCKEYLGLTWRKGEMKRLCPSIYNKQPCKLVTQYIGTIPVKRAEAAFEVWKIGAGTTWDSGDAILLTARTGYKATQIGGDPNPWTPLNDSFRAYIKVDAEGWVSIWRGIGIGDSDCGSGNGGFNFSYNTGTLLVPTGVVLAEEATFINTAGQVTSSNGVTASWNGLHHVI